MTGKHPRQVDPAGSQHKRFADAARKLGADDDQAFDRALKKVASAPPPQSVEKRKDKKPPSR